MFKRREHSYRFVGIKSLCLACLFLICCIMPACGYYTESKIDDYKRFIAALKYQEDEKKPIDDDTENPSKGNVHGIDGFTPIIDMAFSVGCPFSGNVAFVKNEDGRNFILHSNGDLLEADEDLSDVNFIDGKYITKANGLLGVNDIYGTCILAPEYDTVQIMGACILGTKFNSASMFVNGLPIAQTVFKKQVSMLNEEYIFLDGSICDIHFTKMTSGGYPFADIPAEGIVTVKMNGGYMGYMNLDTHQRIGGQYVATWRFHEGVAIAQKEDGQTVIIDTNGKELYSTKDKIITQKSDGYYCYVTHNSYGVMNDRFETIIEPSFMFIRYEKVLNGYIIVRYNNGERIYSVEEKSFKTDLYERIIYENGLFFCAHNSGVTVMDNNVKILADCEDAAWGSDVLMIKNNNLYTYYKRIVS